MFQSTAPKTTLASAINILELIYHSIVRSVRKAHGNAVISLLINMLQVFVFMMVFYVMFSILGLRGAALRGDFLLFVMSGIFLFMTHTKAVGAVMGADGPSSPMMKHAPMNTIISILSSALSVLYIQVLSMFTILFIYHAAVTPIEIYEPIGVMGMMLLAWFTGIGVGLVFLAVRPWFPTFSSIASTIYQRANMIASGKMFVANSMPSFMLALFDWNPLFHCIDQARGYMFINYIPRNSNIEYPIYVGLALVMVGLMGEFYTRLHISISWGARR